MMQQNKVRAIFITIFIMGVTLILLMPIMSPVQKGSSAFFWYHACGINIGNAGHINNCLGGIYQPRDNSFIYYESSSHGNILYRVTPDAVKADFPKIIHKIKTIKYRENLTPHQETAYQAWLQEDSNIIAFLAKMREIELANLKKNNPHLYRYVLCEEKQFEKRWIRFHYYWINLLFEFLFLSFLIVYIIWPWMRFATIVYQSIRIVFFPILLFLPYFLGYGQPTFTSIGPTGGILYPWLIVGFKGLPCTSFDNFIMESIPQILKPISQSPGTVISLSGGAVGPIAVAMIGFIFSMLFLCASRVR